jgi:hypothetical protein
MIIYEQIKERLDADSFTDTQLVGLMILLKANMERGKDKSAREAILLLDKMTQFVGQKQSLVPWQGCLAAKLLTCGSAWLSPSSHRAG